MKTAVSIPDSLFEAAERLVRNRRTSRSALYAEALELLLATQDSGEDTTARLNEVYRDSEATLHPGIAASQAAALREDW